MAYIKNPVFSKAVREFLEENLIGRYEFAREAGVSPDTISRICDGSALLTITKEKIAKAMKRYDRETGSFLSDGSF